MSRLSRNRGVRASRARLYHALAATGLKTQAALAERIADQEGLDSAPTHAVNRAFRELPVEMQTLERIASALGVEAVSLYKTSAEPEPAFVSTPDERTGRTLRMAPVLAGLGLAGVMGVAWFSWHGSGPSLGGPEASGPAVSESLELGRTSVLVQPLIGAADTPIAALLRDALARDFAVASAAAVVVVSDLGAAEASDRLRTEVVVDGEVVTLGRLAGVRIYVQVGGLRRQAWAESLPAVRLSPAAPGLAARSAQAIRAHLGLIDDNGVGHFPLAPVQDLYLEGRMFLERPASELNLKRAQTRFEAALRQDSNYARAHAGLCEALLEEHWMEDEQRALEDAARACGQALQLAPVDPVVRAAHAHFLRLTGRLEEALVVYEDVLSGYPDDAAIWAAYSFALLQHYRAQGSEATLEQARMVAKRGAAADVGFWKPPFFLASIEFYSGDVAAAIAAATEARARDENEMVLANLGTFLFCGGDLDQASEAFARAAELAPHSYVGDEYMGLIHYYRGQFDEAVRLRRRAIESVSTGAPEIHQMWGNLADAHRLDGDPESAIEAYLKALEIVERDLLRGTATDSDRAARAWYVSVLARLAPHRVPDALRRQLDQELDALDQAVLDPNAHLRLAATWLERGDPERAAGQIEQATDVCTVFSRSPDLVAW